MLDAIDKLEEAADALEEAISAYPEAQMKDRLAENLPKLQAVKDNLNQQVRAGRALTVRAPARLQRRPKGGGRGRVRRTSPVVRLGAPFQRL